MISTQPAIRLLEQRDILPGLDEAGQFGERRGAVVGHRGNRRDVGAIARCALADEAERALLAG